MTRKMRHVSCGSETTERLNILLTQLTIGNDDMVGALHDYFVKGHIIRVCCELNGIDSTSNLERDINRVNDVAAFVAAIEDHDWARFKSDNQKTEGTVTTQKLGPLYGETWVLTGKLAKMSRSTAKKKLESLGATVSGSVSSKTNCLLAGEAAGAKLTKAESLEVKVISEPEFIKLTKKLEK